MKITDEVTDVITGEPLHGTLPAEDPQTNAEVSQSSPEVTPE